MEERVKTPMSSLMMSLSRLLAIISMIIWCTLVFPTLSQLYRGGQYTYPCFPSIISSVLRTIFVPSHPLLFNITIMEIMDNGERGMNPVAMTIINLRKYIGQAGGSNQRPPVQMPCCTLLAELRGFGQCLCSFRCDVAVLDLLIPSKTMFI